MTKMKEKTTLQLQKLSDYNKHSLKECIQAYLYYLQNENREEYVVKKLTSDELLFHVSSDYALRPAHSWKNKLVHALRNRLHFANDVPISEQDVRNYIIPGMINRKVSASLCGGRMIPILSEEATNSAGQQLLDYDSWQLLVDRACVIFEHEIVDDLLSSMPTFEKRVTTDHDYNLTDGRELTFNDWYIKIPNYDAEDQHDVAMRKFGTHLTRKARTTLSRAKTGVKGKVTSNKTRCVTQSTRVTRNSSAQNIPNTADDI